MKFISIKSILVRLSRETGHNSFNESDVIEYIGDALGLIEFRELKEEVIGFFDVKDNKMMISGSNDSIPGVPNGFVSVLQLAKYNDSNQDLVRLPKNEYDENGKLIGSDSSDKDKDPVYLRPKKGPYSYMDSPLEIKWGYFNWTSSDIYRKAFTPIRLANNKFFKSVVSKEKDFDKIYNNITDEYTVLGNYNDGKSDLELLFSFKEGKVALCYLKNRIDDDGYPIIPDIQCFSSAIINYIKWKLTEVDLWNHRQGSGEKIQYFQKEWLRYASQCRSYVNIPETLDEYMDILRDSHNIVPKDRYSNFFNNYGLHG